MMDGNEKKKYRQSKQWKDFRKLLIENCDYTCEICGIKKKKGLHIHHINECKYGKETIRDVAVLCSSCHKLVEWLLSRTKNKVDIDNFCKRLKIIYKNTKEENNG